MLEAAQLTFLKHNFILNFQPLQMVGYLSKVRNERIKREYKKSKNDFQKRKKMKGNTKRNKLLTQNEWGRRERKPAIK